MAAVAGGILQHLRDDARFHATRAFAETSLELTVRVRDALGGETGLRPAFLGHLLVELLLDAALIADDPGRLDRVLPRVGRGRRPAGRGGRQPHGAPADRAAGRRSSSCFAANASCGITWKMTN